MVESCCVYLWIVCPFFWVRYDMWFWKLMFDVFKLVFSSKVLKCVHFFLSFFSSFLFGLVCIDDHKMGWEAELTISFGFERLGLCLRFVVTIFLLFGHFFCTCVKVICLSLFSVMIRVTFQRLCMIVLGNMPIIYWQALPTPNFKLK